MNEPIAWVIITYIVVTIIMMGAFIAYSESDLDIDFPIVLLLAAVWPIVLLMALGYSPVSKHLKNKQDDNAVNGG